MKTLAPVALAAWPRRAAGVALPLAAWPFLLLPFDSLTHILGIGESSGAQTFPATAALSLLYLALRGARLRFTPASLKTFKCLAAVWLIMMLLTAGHMVLESVMSTHLEETLRGQTALRQGVSFTLGLSSFLMFQDALQRVGHRAAFRWIIWGCMPAFALAPFQAFTGVNRVQGLSSEPSQMADTLVFAFLPACAAAALRPRLRWPLIALGTVTLLSTFSSTGFMKMGLVLLCFYISSGRVLRGLWVLLAGVAAGYGVLSLWPENYVFSTITILYRYWDSASDVLYITFIDRYMGLVGPLSMLNQPRAWLGLGFGADSVYFYQMFDPAVAEAIRDVKWVLPSIGSLQGKVLMYSGLGGYAVYLAAWLTARRATPQGHPARYMIPALYLASLFSLAPFFLGYAWLWLALGSTAGAKPPASAATTARLGT